MSDTAELLQFLDEYPATDCSISGFSSTTDEFVLAGIISNADELLRTVDEYRKDGDDLRATLQSLKETTCRINSQYEEAVAAGKRAEAELAELKDHFESLEREKVNLEWNFKETVAQLEDDNVKRCKYLEELLQDVTRQYLLQQDALTYARGIRSSVKSSWRQTGHSLNTRLEKSGVCSGVFESLKDVLSKEATNVVVHFRDVGTTCNIVKTRTCATNTTSQCTVDVGINTITPTRVTRSTQSSSKGSTCQDQGTMCDMEAECVTDDMLRAIFRDTICEVPVILEELADLPRLSVAVQATAVENRTVATITDLHGIKEQLEWKRPPDRVKIEETENYHRMARLNFEHLWSLLGQSIVALTGSEHHVSNSDKYFSRLFYPIAHKKDDHNMNAEPFLRGPFDLTPPSAKEERQTPQSLVDEEVIDICKSMTPLDVDESLVNRLSLATSEKERDMGRNESITKEEEAIQSILKRKHPSKAVPPLKKIKLLPKSKLPQNGHKTPPLIGMVRDFYSLPDLLEPIAELEYSEAIVEAGDTLNDSRLCPEDIQETIPCTDNTEADPYADSPKSPAVQEIKDEHVVTIIPLNLQRRHTNGQKGLNRLALSNSIFNQFLRQFTSKRKMPHRIKKNHQHLFKSALKKYLDADWTSASVEECVNAFNPAVIESEENGDALVRFILDHMEPCTDDLIYEPFACFAPFMPKTHQQVVLLIVRLGLEEKTIAQVEQRLFHFKVDGLHVKSIINLTYIYLSLQDLQVNKDLSSTSKLRLFMAKALYYLNRKSVCVLYMTLKAFPKLMPRITADNPPWKNSPLPFEDPLIETVACVLSLSETVLAAKDSEEHPTIREYRGNLYKLVQTYYIYKLGQFTATDCLALLVNRLRSGDLLNLEHCFLVLGKRMGWHWAQDVIICKELEPLLNVWLTESAGTSTKESEGRICVVISVIAGIVKSFPRTEDVSKYRTLFKRIIHGDRGYSQEIQEAAVMAILKMTAFGFVDTYRAIRNWCIALDQNVVVSAQLAAMIKTFISRRPTSYWVQRVQSK